MDRDLARAIKNEISGIAPQTTYNVEDGKLYVTVPGGLHQAQRELIKRYRDNLIELFSTPPPIVGICRRGHAVQWMLTKNGDWICRCYNENEQHTYNQPPIKKVKLI
jgi:hypothetical protein